MFLGVISPKIKINKVKTPVAIPAPRLMLSSRPRRVHTEKAYDVEIEEADRFTILLQIKTVLNILEGFSISFNTRFAALFLSSAKARIFNLLTVVSEVSAEEKNADSSSNTIRIIIFFASLGPKKNHSIS